MRRKRTTSRPPDRPVSNRVFVYKLVTDNGGAPCVRNGLLTLALCKPVIRRVARVGDWLYGFGGRNLEERLIYVARVTERIEQGLYYVDRGRYRAFRGRPDRIYRRVRGRFRRKRRALYHDGPRNLQHDLGVPPRYARAIVLVSSDFRYLGRDGTVDYRNDLLLAKFVSEVGRGHRVVSGAVRERLGRLQRKLWKDVPPGAMRVATDPVNPAVRCH